MKFAASRYRLVYSPGDVRPRDRARLALPALARALLQPELAGGYDDVGLWFIA